MSFLNHAKKYILLSIIPLGALIALMYYYAVDVPYYDEFAAAGLLEKFYSGTLTFSDIIASHSEHRIVIWRIVTILNALLFNWNLYLGNIINVIFAICSSIVIYYAVEKLTNLDSKKRMILYFTGSCFIFSFTQQHNFLWSFQMQIFGSVFFTLFSILLLVYGGRFGTFFAGLSAIIGTFSFANGMLIWPIGLFVIIACNLLNHERINYSKIILWLIFAGLTLFFYFYGQPSMPANLFFIITHPHYFIINFFAYLGSSVSNFRESQALGAGIIGLSLHVYCFIKLIRNKKCDRNIIFWIAVDLYVILSSAATAYGRHYDISNGMSLRYVSINMLFWVVTPVILFMTLESENRIPIKCYLLVAAILCSLSVSEDSMIRARESSEGRRAFKQQIISGHCDERIFMRSVFPANIEHNIFTRSQFQITFPILKKYGVNNFTNAPDIKFNDFRSVSLISTDITQENNTDFAIDLIKDDYNNNEFLTLEGWWSIDSFSEHDRNIARTFILFYDNNSAFEASLDSQLRNQRENYRIARYSDSNAHFQRKNFAGYQIYCAALPKGNYNLAIKVESYGGKLYYFPLNKTINIQ